MTKVYKLEVLIIDHDDVGLEEAISLIEDANYPNYCLSPHVMKSETKKIKWRDSHPFNQSTTMQQTYEDLFGE